MQPKVLLLQVARLFSIDIIAIPAIIYALMMNIILLVYVGIVKRK